MTFKEAVEILGKDNEFVVRHDEAKITQHHMRQAMGNIDFHIGQLEEKIIRIAKQAKYGSED